MPPHRLDPALREQNRFCTKANSVGDRRERKNRGQVYETGLRHAVMAENGVLDDDVDDVASSSVVSAGDWIKDKQLRALLGAGQFRRRDLGDGVDSNDDASAPASSSSSSSSATAAPASSASSSSSSSSAAAPAAVTAYSASTSSVAATIDADDDHEPADDSKKKKTPKERQPEMDVAIRAAFSAMAGKPDTMVCLAPACSYSSDTKAGNLYVHFKGAHPDLVRWIEQQLGVEKKSVDEAVSALRKRLETLRQTQRLDYQFNKGGPIATTVRKHILTALFIASGRLPLSIVNNKYFRVLSNVTVSRRTITRVIRVVARLCKLQVKDSMANMDMVSVTGDGYAAQHKRSFQSVTAHGLDDKWNRRNVMLSIERLRGKHDSARIAAYTKRVIDEFTNEDALIGAMTTDGAEAAVADALVGKGNGVTCFSHTLQLVVHAGIDGDDFKQAIERIRSLVVFCRSSRLVMEKLADAIARQKKANRASNRHK